MAKGSYTGGSTIIYPSGRGWSYDPLEAVRPSKTVKKKAYTGRELNNFAFACAIYSTYNLPWPESDEYKSPSSKFNLNYLKSFKKKVLHSKKKALGVFKGYVYNCASSDLLGQDRPNLPKIIHGASYSPGFEALIEGEILKASKRATSNYKRSKTLMTYAEICMTNEQKGEPRPEIPEQLIRAFNENLKSMTIEKAIEKAKRRSGEFEIVKKHRKRYEGDFEIVKKHPKSYKEAMRSAAIERLNKAK